MPTLTPIQRAMLQLKRHADFKNPEDPQDKAKAGAYRHSLQIVKLFTGEEIPTEPVSLADAKKAHPELALT